MSTHYKFIENDKIDEGTLLNETNDSSHPFDYRLEKCGVNFFKTLEHSEIHTFYPLNEEDEENGGDDLAEEDVEDEVLIETNYTNGNKEVVKIFNQKCV